MIKFVKNLIIYVSVLLLCMAFPLLSGCRTAARFQPVVRTSFALDTVISVTVYDEADLPAADDALALAASYEKIFSRTAEDSELYRLNKAMQEAASVVHNFDALTLSFPVSEELYRILSECMKYRDASPEGRKAFDCTLGALSACYNFSGETHRVPGKDECRLQLSHSGMDKISLEAPDQLITSVTSDPALVLDLGAIAKGYIADRMKEQMVSAGVKSGIINLGGNVLLIGSRPDGSDFEVGIADPEHPADFITTVKLSDAAVVTSGIYQRCFTENGKEYHHILDPETGYPVENDLASVTVIADNATAADALSTTLFVLGPESEKALTERFSLMDVIFIDRSHSIR